MDFDIDTLAEINTDRTQHLDQWVSTVGEEVEAAHSQSIVRAVMLVSVNIRFVERVAVTENKLSA
jgi:predicted thioesterase